MNNQTKQYLAITGNYWGFTLTDGALRMLVVLYFHQLGYGALAIASLFLLYELFGIVTNLFGGWLATRIGLNQTMQLGMTLQVVALAMLLVPAEMLVVSWVMLAQACSGIAKDLNKMSAKSAVKLMVENNNTTLFKWVSFLTGSKNTLKGVGFFLGGLLLNVYGFQGAIWGLMAMLVVCLVLTGPFLTSSLGKLKSKAKFSEVFSTSKAVNYLSAARLFLFSARDFWFVVALPVYLQTHLHWQYWQVASFLACWVIGYGIVQSVTPWLLNYRKNRLVCSRQAFRWSLPLVLLPCATALAMVIDPQWAIITGLALFAGFFAINSAIHSYLIVDFAKAEGASMDIGFYYMANASGRLLGTILSGLVYQFYGLEACLWGASGLLLICSCISYALYLHDRSNPSPV